MLRLCFGWTFALTLLLSASFVCAQDQDEDVPPADVSSGEPEPDPLLDQVVALAAGVTRPDIAVLSQALHVGEKVEDDPSLPPKTLAPLGDLDGDGVPEMVLSWPLPAIERDAASAAIPGQHLLWSFYLLSWNRTSWKASSLGSAIGESTVRAINLARPLGRAIAVVTSESPSVYPSVFQIKDHAAVLLWDSQADQSRYEPLLQGHVEFQSHGSASAEMIVSGRADPGLLEIDPNGRRGFNARAVYHWDGQAYMPVSTVFSPNQDYTLYRFISALHLHDFRSAYALIVPGQFLAAAAPTVDSFREFIRDTWPEFVGDSVFRAREAPAGSPDDYAFELSVPGKHYLYRPTFSTDGKLLLTGLTRTTEVVAAEPEPKEP